MAKVNYHVRAGKKISLDTMLILLVMLVSVAMFFLTLNGTNPFLDGMTSLVVLLMSAFLIVVMWINRSFRIPLLDIFVLVYIVFWHFRFLTLALFPDGELVLSRTVMIDHEIFNSYVWVVFISLIATVAGIILAHSISNAGSRSYLENEKMWEEELSNAVIRNINSIFVYCVLALVFQIATSQAPEETLPAWLGYLTFFFPFSLIMLLMTTVLINKKVGAGYKLLFFGCLVSFVTFTVLMGSRSILLYFVLAGLFIFSIFHIKIHIGFNRIVLILLLGLIAVLSFAYGTYQRHMREIYGTNANSESIQYVLERISSMEEQEAWEPMIGMASARAGYLDYSAEMYANPKYKDEVTIENILKSVIDGYIPGAVFEDSRLIAVRLRDVYNPMAEGYQSDALGAVGENYLLFGYAFPVAIALVAFAFTYLYYAVSGNIYGIYLKFLVAVWFMTWWNSFGYDWLLLDIGRQIVFGMLVIALIFRRLGELPQNNKVGSVSA